MVPEPQIPPKNAVELSEKRSPALKEFETEHSVAFIPLNGMVPVGI